MKIRIDDDYDKNDLEKFNINSGSINNEDAKDDMLDSNIIEATFQEVKSDNEEYDTEYRDFYSRYEASESHEEESNVLGEIIVTSRLANANRTLISSAKINLYILNGVSPKLIQTQYTNNDGEVRFENLKKGSYRIIAIVDRKYFEKPTYSPWNEVTIDSSNTETYIEVINKIKSM